MKGARSTAHRRTPAGLDARHAGHLRGLNLERVLSVAMERPDAFTRSELMAATRLSAPTIGSLSAHLLREGLLSDLGTGPSSGGRRPSYMEFNARFGYVVGVDLGPTTTRLAVADLRGERLAQRIVPTPVGRTPRAHLEGLARSVRALLKETRVPLGRLLAVAAGAPGAVDRERGVVGLAPNLPGWVQVPMRDILQRALKAPVHVENDVNLAVLGEHWKGAARGHETCAFVFAGTGIGSGILVDGELLHGRHFQAGEIALMCMGPQYVDEDFGSRGCLETLVGLQALAGRWRGARRAERSAWIAALVDAARDGDRRARRVLGDATRLIGIAIANLCAVLDPSLVVLGGPLFANGGDLVDEIRRIVLRVTRSPMDIVASALGKEAPLAGTLLLASSEARQHLRLRLHQAGADPLET